ncbi:MAG: hypothetical protein KGJ61_08790 [Candidatus Omnitrophica bacterium]|nr:hypothetical protein [Candidatus Omnitrophota bacterium]
MGLWFVIGVVVLILSLILFFLPPTRFAGVCIFILYSIFSFILLIRGQFEKNDDNRFKKDTTAQIEQLVNAQKTYMKEQFEIQQQTGELISPSLRTEEGPYQVMFGSNIFINTPNILIVGGVPLVTMKVVNGELLVSAIIYDGDGGVIAMIKDNKWIYQRSKNFKKEVRLNLIKIWDGQNRLLLDCEMLSNTRIKLNGVFRKDGSEIIATDEGLRINSVGKWGVGLGGG